MTRHKVILGPPFAWIILLPNHCKIGSHPARYLWNHLNQTRLRLHCFLMLPVKSNKDDVTPKDTNVFEMPNLRDMPQNPEVREVSTLALVLQERLGVKSKLGCHLASHLGGLEWVNYSVFVGVFFAIKNVKTNLYLGWWNALDIVLQPGWYTKKAVKYWRTVPSSSSKGQFVSLRMMLNTPIHAPSTWVLTSP